MSSDKPEDNDKAHENFPNEQERKESTPYLHLSTDQNDSGFIFDDDIAENADDEADDVSETGSWESSSTIHDDQPFKDPLDEDDLLVVTKNRIIRTFEGELDTENRIIRIHEGKAEMNDWITSIQPLQKAEHI